MNNFTLLKIAAELSDAPTLQITGIGLAQV